MDCSDVRDDMLDVLYGEATPAARRRVEEHQAACAECREEMAALGGVRRQLGAWRQPSAAPTRARRLAVQAWPYAAAAGLLLALGGAFGLSGSELALTDGRLSFRLGRAPAPEAGADARVQQLLAAQEARHREEISALRAGLTASAPAPAAVSAPAGGVTLEQVAQMIRASESRQARALDVSLDELGRRTEAQRRYDLARVSAGLAYLDDKTGREVARTTDLMGQVLQASQKR